MSTLILLVFGLLAMSAVYNNYSNALQTNYITKANFMNPDQTAPIEFDLGPYCLQYRCRPSKYISRRESRQHLL